MQQISTLFGPIETKSKIVNERQAIVKEFVDAINQERIGTKWKPLEARAIAIHLGQLKSNRELYEFLSICRDYKNRYGSFGKRFFGKWTPVDKVLTPNFMGV